MLEISGISQRRAGMGGTGSEVSGEANETL